MSHVYSAATRIDSSWGSRNIKLHARLPSCPHFIDQLESQHFSLAAESSISNNQNVLNLCEAPSAVLTTSEAGVLNMRTLDY